MGESNETKTSRKGRPRKEATGHDFALQRIKKKRNETAELIEMLDASQRVARNSIFLPAGIDGRQSVHGRAHASLISYADELTKPTYLMRINAQKFYIEDYAEAQIPKTLAEDGEITVTVDNPNVNIDVSNTPMEMTGWPITLENLEWWSMRFITIRKTIESPYWKDGELTEERKVVLPPRIIRETFRRLDSLAAELGVLINVDQGSQHDRT